tara:strand:- start:242 stop:721 length:480 start_codon:yes stop_codon:yes gene_type:complete
MDNTMNNAPVQKQGIKISKVLELMKDGYSRTSDSKSYNPEIGSVQEYFSLSDHEVKHLFSFSRLKNAKTSTAKPINFYIEMEDEEGDDLSEPITNVAPTEVDYGNKVAVPGVTSEGVVEVELEELFENSKVTDEEPKTVLSFNVEDLADSSESMPTPFQ